ncbi:MULTISPECIES: hypothetical protein [unclassified Arsukibacterium]|uniref:hypothetical protein n=1 Tax=unclassified Arsukibacterium TaxID=2635278 RepID=UPI0025C5E954|nr:MULTISPECIES: hypothetical protein [unclassified Arsukibacterium]|tara:strand:+ start:4685 stop:5581 length:897 start_codon:yes stop_codon:yes gene_type:complete
MMKYTFCFALILSLVVLFPPFAAAQPGKWCQSTDAGKTCSSYVSYFENGDVYGYGVNNDLLYIATGYWRQHSDQLCLNLIYKTFDIVTEQPFTPDDRNICDTVLSQSKSLLSVQKEDGSIATFYQISETPDHSMSPAPSQLAENAGKVKPKLLALNVPPGRFGLYPLPLEMAPASVSFNMSLTPIAADDNTVTAYANVQIGDPDNDYLRVSLLQPKDADSALLMIEYIMPGYKPFRKALASDITPGEAVLIHLDWQPDGLTTVSYKDQTVQYKLPLEQWQSYFMASNTKATFQRLPEE